MHKSTTLFKISFFTFAFCFFTFAVSLAQENKVSKIDKIQTVNSNLPNAPQAEEGDVKITDGTHTLIRITDEGTFGAIEINHGVPSATTDKLYNDNGTLKFGTTSLGGGTTTYAVGDLAQGGYVIEVTPDGKHGLVAALQNQGKTFWGDLHNYLSDPIRHDTYGKNYKDWRFPSTRELNLMYIQKIDIGGFQEDFIYWSSIEGYEWSHINAQNFADGTIIYRTHKNGSGYLRAVRAF